MSKSQNDEIEEYDDDEMEDQYDEEDQDLQEIEEDDDDDDEGESNDDNNAVEVEQLHQRSEMTEHGVDSPSDTNKSSAQEGSTMNVPSNRYTQETLEEEEDIDDVEKDENGTDDGEIEEANGEHEMDEGDIKDDDKMDAVEENDDDTSLEADEDDGKDNTKTGEENAGKVEASVKNKDAKPEATSYSTRGRAHEENNLDRLAAVGDLLSLGGSHRDAAANALLQSPETRIRESFLSDSLTEEERRTRTRYIPSVDGMHALRKHEIKNDLVLARSSMLANAVSEKVPRGSKRKQTDDESSGIDAVDNNTVPSDDAIMSTEEDRGNAGSSAKTFEIGSKVLNIPSAAFVAPSLDNSMKRSTPREVDVVVAFNPPRPPESIGAKKKHRMLRWERRPADIESDLSNYRKTVQKTREELKSAEGELERIRVVDNQLRRHFLNHIDCMNAELVQIGEEIATVQQECIDMSDIPSNRTRTRGAFKGTNAMKDVLHTLRTKGKEIESKGLSITRTPTKSTNCSGAGGVSKLSFVDWDRSTTVEPCKVAQAWVVPGDKVTTSYGDGIVLAVYGPSTLDATELPNPGIFPKAINMNSSVDAMDVDGLENQTPAVDGGAVKKKLLKGGKNKESDEDIKSLKNILAPRVAVQLAFGVAFFNFDTIRSDEDPSAYTDDQLAKRWSGIADTALSFGSAVMTNFQTGENSKGVSQNLPLDMEEGNEADIPLKHSNRRLLPIGAGMFPTVVGRGTLLHRASMSELDENVNKVFFHGYGPLGSKENKGVPNDIRKLEDQHQEHINLQAKVLQLRNQLYRQRRIRILNERTYASSQERASRVESLVAEMRIDLKSLKSRLDMEIRELGISDEQAEGILKAFYTSQDSQHAYDESPPSRPRRFSSMNDGDDDDVDVPNMDVATDTDVTASDPKQ